MFYFNKMAPEQRHSSEPIVCQENPLIPEGERGSTSLVEMLHCCRKHSLSKTLGPAPRHSGLCPRRDVSPSGSRDSPQSPLTSPSPLLPQRHHHDQCSHHPALLSLPLRCPPELCLRALFTQQSPHHHHHHCKACVALLLGDRTEAGGSLGHQCLPPPPPSPQHSAVYKPPSPVPPLLSLVRRPQPFTLPSLLATPSPLVSANPGTPPSPATSPSPVTSPSRLAPPSPLALSPRGSCGGGHLTLLDQCLHHIVSRKSSSNTVPERGSNNRPGAHSHGEAGASGPTDQSQSLDVTFFFGPYLDRSLVLSPHDSEDMVGSMVG